MYTRFQLAKKYINYYFTAANSKGHGMHSPFVFDFIIHVLNDKRKYSNYKEIEGKRRDLLAIDRIIEVEDFGAGSTVLPFKQRRIKDIAASSLKPKKYAQLLFRIARYYQSKTIVELGTSLGTTTMYLASANDKSVVYSLEGAPAIAEIASENFTNAGFKNIRLTVGSFEKTLPIFLPVIEKADLLFIDGNHRKEATLNYFERFLNKKDSNSIFIFDDIHWSNEMEEAWDTIKAHPEVTLTIDLFFIGLVFFKKDFKVKQHFKIRF